MLLLRRQWLTALLVWPFTLLFPRDADARAPTWPSRFRAEPYKGYLMSWTGWKCWPGDADKTGLVGQWTAYPMEAYLWSATHTQVPLAPRRRADGVWVIEHTPQPPDFPPYLVAQVPRVPGGDGAYRKGDRFPTLSTSPVRPATSITEKTRLIELGEIEIRRVVDAVRHGKAVPRIGRAKNHG